MKSGWRPFPASSAVRFRLDLLPEHQKKTDGQQQTAGPDGPCSPELGGNAAESGPQGKNEDDGEVAAGLPQGGPVPGVPVGAEGVHPAADWDTASNTSKNKQVEGVILGGNARPDMIAELQNRDLAVVLVNNRIQGLDIPCVVSDEYGGVRQALEHLIGRGHRNIAMLAGRFSPYILGERYRAFLEVTQAHGLPADTRHIKLCDPTVESAAEACLELLSRQDRPTAIFGGNDVMAAGAMKAALRLGLRVPEDLAVTGLDDSSACGMLEPELTSVHIDCRRMGELSVARLQALLAGETDVPQVTVVPTELRVRGSS